jgi:MipA family protein
VKRVKRLSAIATAIAIAAAFSRTASAQTSTAPPASATPLPTPLQTSQNDKEGWNGIAGAGPMTFPKYSGSRDQQTLPLPLLSINYDETFFVEIQRVGVYVLASDDKKMGMALALEPRLGWTAKDGSRLSGMSARKSSIEAGVTFDWEMDHLSISAGLFTDSRIISGASRGTSQRLQLYTPLIKNNRTEFGGLISFDRLSREVANTYYGVRLSEATPARAAFQAPQATNVSIGFAGTHKLDAKNGILFGLNVTQLDRSIARSPIVEKRASLFAYIGYGWNL